MLTNFPIDLKTPGASSDRPWRSSALSANLLISTCRRHGKGSAGRGASTRSRAANGSKLLRVVGRDHQLAARSSAGCGGASVAIQTRPDAKYSALISKFADKSGKGYWGGGARAEVGHV